MKNHHCERQAVVWQITNQSDEKKTGTCKQLPWLDCLKFENLHGHQCLQGY